MESGNSQVPERHGFLDVCGDRNSGSVPSKLWIKTIQNKTSKIVSSAG